MIKRLSNLLHKYNSQFLKCYRCKIVYENDIIPLQMSGCYVGCPECGQPLTSYHPSTLELKEYQNGLHK